MAEIAKINDFMFLELEKTLKIGYIKGDIYATVFYEGDEALEKFKLYKTYQNIYKYFEKSTSVRIAKTLHSILKDHIDMHNLF